MFNIGPMELLLILLVALIVVGPRRLPEVGRSIGKGLRELRKAQDEVRETLTLELNEEPTAKPRRRPARPAAKASPSREGEPPDEPEPPSQEPTAPGPSSSE
jgi:Tat protein translocase TatB subunit